LPGVVVLQVLPRLLSEDADLGIAAALAPVFGMLLGASAAGFIGGGWRGGALAGLASQAGAVPGLATITASMLGEGFLVDAAVYAGIFYASLAFCVTAGAGIAGRVTMDIKGAGQARAPVLHAGWGIALLAGSLLLVAAAIFVLGIEAPWYYAIVLSTGAAAQALPVVFLSGGWTRRPAMALSIVSLALAAFSMAALAAYVLVPVAP
jgi:hypothetical protein